MGTVGAGATAGRHPKVAAGWNLRQLVDSDPVHESVAFVLENLPPGLRVVASGELCDAVTGRTGSQAMLEQVERAGLAEPLTGRELEVLRLLAAGKSNQRIAHDLVVALDTVKKHVTHLLGKLGVANRTEAVARARDLGLIP
jgi:DNA-binding NarL/FixJ family response regulator